MGSCFILNENWICFKTRFYYRRHLPVSFCYTAKSRDVEHNIIIFQLVNRSGSKDKQTKKQKNRVHPIGLLVTSPDALPLSYRRLVEVMATKLGSFTVSSSQEQTHWSVCPSTAFSIKAKRYFKRCRSVILRAFLYLLKAQPWRQSWS